MVFLKILLLTISCSNEHTSIEEINENSLSNYIDTLATEVDVLSENIQYVGFIDNFYFSNDNEVYIELYFKKGKTSLEEYEKIITLTDSLIYKDEDNSRNRLPQHIAANYFDLRGLSKLKIYDNNHKFVCNATFLRVEYLDQNISSVFIAVFKPEQKIQAQHHYVISNFDGKIEKEIYTVSNDTIQTQNILTKLNERKSYYERENNGTHLQFLNSDTVLTILNTENHAYVVLKSSQNFTILYKSNSPENIIDLKIIPLSKSQFPYILTRNNEPDSDYIYDKLLIFDGKKYTVSKEQRIDF